MGRFREQFGPALRDVDHGGRAEEDRERGHDGQQRARPAGPGRGVDETDRQRDGDRALVAGTVHRQVCRVAEQQRTEGGEEEQRRERHEHESERVRGGRVRTVRFERREHSRREVGRGGLVAHRAIVAPTACSANLARADGAHPVRHRAHTRRTLRPVDRLTTLLLDARDGDRDAFAAAIRESQSDVTAFVRSYARACDVDDVVQDTYVRVWGALASFRAAGTGRAWILSIARRACADAVRAAQRRRRILHRATEQASRFPAHEPDPAATHALGALIGALDDERREAIVLTQVLGLSYEEAAQVCGVPVGTIRSRIARGRAAARAAATG